jgi:hypothetical protein
VVCTTLEVTVRVVPDASEYVAEAWLLIDAPAGGGAACAATPAITSAKTTNKLTIQ